MRGLQGRAPWVPDTVRDADCIVMLILDGFGWDELEARRAALPNIASMDGGPITTVVPSTTPTALVSFSTGLTPAEHGIIGYRIFLQTDRGNGVLNVIRWAMGGVRPPDAADMQPREAFGGQAIPVVTRAQFRDTKFSEIQYAGAPMSGWFTTSGLVEHCRRLVAAGERFVYAYYDGVDLVGHMHGLRDEFFSSELAFCDTLVGEILDALPSTAALVVTADHGHVQFEERIELGALEPMIAVHSGESRFRYLHAESGAADDLADAARDMYSSHTWIFTRDQLIDEGWLGPRAPSSEVRKRIGDVILAARGPVGYVDPQNPGESTFLSGHGSLTGAEMFVPFVAGRGRAWSDLSLPDTFSV